MILNLFQLAGLATVGWLMLIFLPTWRVTRRVAGSSIFPIYLASLYAFGIGSVLVQNGPGFMRDFGSPEGVMRLLAQRDVALIAWIHILAFDQAIGLHIYRESMRRRLMPIPIQSVVLFSTFMLGPIGYLMFQAVRMSRLGGAAFEPVREEKVATAERAELDGEDLASPAWTSLTTVRGVIGLWAQERSLTRVAFLSIAIGFGCVIAVLLRGAAVPPEGDLTKPAAFDIALGIYLLSIIPWAPLSGMSDRLHRSWRGWLTSLAILAISIETIQHMRGIDPRFTRVEPLSRILGAVFFVIALGIVAAFVVLAVRFFNARTAGNGKLLILAARYAALSTMMGFAAGIWISANQGRNVGTHGNIMPLHAAGFHSLQALPLVALLLIVSGVTFAAGRRWVHAAGIAWCAGCAGIWWQVAQGRAVTELSGTMMLVIVAYSVWAITLVRGLFAWGAASRQAGTALPA